MNWRLIEDGGANGAWNMAVDESILDAVAMGIAPPTIRFYRWESPCVSVGRFQEIVRSIDVEACRKNGVEIVRRLTGGRAVLHGGDLTVTIVTPVAALGTPGVRVVSSYKYLSRGFVEGFRWLDIRAQMGACERRTDRPGDCFATRSRADLIGPDGVKLVGSAQCRRDGTILQQSSVRHRPPNPSAGHVFRDRVGDSTFPLAGYDDGMVAGAVRNGLRTALGVDFDPGSLTEWEYERVGAVMGRYAPLTLVDRGTGI